MSATTTPHAPTKLLTRQQIQREYGFPARSIYDWIVNGTLPVVRIPGTRRLWIRRQDVEQMISNSVTATSGLYKSNL